MTHVERFTPVPLALAIVVLGACGDAPPTQPDPTGSGDVVSPAFDRGPRPPWRPRAAFGAHETICEFSLGEENPPDEQGVVHFRDRRAITRAEADDPRYTGSSDVTFSGHQDAAGNGSGFGRFTFQPDGIDGTWVGFFTGGWTAGLFTGQAVAFGTGELEDQLLYSRIEEIPAGPEDPRHTCAPVLPGGPLFVHDIRVVDVERGFGQPPSGG